MGYVGPARVMNGSLQGDSLLLVFRRFDLGVKGTLDGREGVAGRVLRFAATPWDFSATWARRAVERAEMHPTGDGWKLDGVMNQGTMRQGSHEPYYRFSLELSAGGEPKRLAIGRDGDRSDLIVVRYGPERRYEAGRIPSWIEWSFSGSVLTLHLEDLSPADPEKIRYGTPIEPDWTIVSLDEPAGQRLVRWLLGLSEGGTER